MKEHEGRQDSPKEVLQVFERTMYAMTEKKM